MTQQIGSWLLEAFQKPWIQYLALPLFAVLVTIALRALSRPDRNQLFEIKREDFLVGIGLGVTGFFTLATTLIKVSEKYTAQIKALAQAGSSGDTAAAVASQQKITGLFTFVFGMTSFFVVFLVVMILMALVMSHRGWDTKEGTPPVPKLGYLVAFDLIGLALLMGAIYSMGELGALK
jgi:hypothetical protein